MSYLSVLLLLCLWFDRCESLTDSSVPAIFYPFGTDQGDSVLPVGDESCQGPISIPYKIFSYTEWFKTYKDPKVCRVLLFLNVQLIYTRGLRHLRQAVNLCLPSNWPISCVLDTVGVNEHLRGVQQYLTTFGSVTQSFLESTRKSHVTVLLRWTQTPSPQSLQ